MAHDHDGQTAKLAKAADHGLIVGEFAVAAQLHEILDQKAQIVDQVRPFRMARHLRLLPGIQARIGLAPQNLDPALQGDDLGIEGSGTCGLRQAG